MQHLSPTYTPVQALLSYLYTRTGPTPVQALLPYLHTDSCFYESTMINIQMIHIYQSTMWQYLKVSTQVVNKTIYFPPIRLEGLKMLPPGFGDAFSPESMPSLQSVGQSWPPATNTFTTGVYWQVYLIKQYFPTSALYDHINTYILLHSYICVLPEAYNSQYIQL